MDEDVWFSLRYWRARVESPGARVFPLVGLSSSLKGLGPRRPFAGTGGRLGRRDYIMGVCPYLPPPPLTPHQDFAERNGFCTRSFFIIKLTVSTPSSRPRLLPGEATPPSGFGVGSPSQFGRCTSAAGARPYVSVFLGWLCPQSFKHAPSYEGTAQVQAVITQKQFVVAHERVRESAKADAGAQQV